MQYDRFSPTERRRENRRDRCGAHRWLHYDITIYTHCYKVRHYKKLDKIYFKKIMRWTYRVFFAGQYSERVHTGQAKI